MPRHSSTSTIRRPKSPKREQGQAAYNRMIDNATDNATLQAAVYAARGTPGVDMKALRARASKKRKNLRG